MSDKDFEKDNINGENGVSSNPAPADSESSNKADYEEESSWKFEASAPSLNADFLQSAGDAEIKVEAPQYYAPEPAAPQANQVASKDIVIKKEKVTVILSSIIAVIVIAIIAVLGVRYYTVPNSDERMNPGNIAVTIGNTDVSVGLYNYYYDSIVYEYTYYAAYGYYDLDTTKDFGAQFTKDEEGNELSWEAYFRKLALQRLTNYTMNYEKALEAGITLTDEQKEQIDSQLESIKEQASSENKSVNEYVNEKFGENCGLETLRKFLEQYFIAGNYYNRSTIENRPSEDEVNAYFDENSNKYQSCSIALIELEYDTTDDDTKAKSIENAKSYMSKITDVDSMKKIMPEASASLIEQYVSAGYFETQEEAVQTLLDSIESTETRTNFESYFDEDTASWLFDEATPVNSVNYFASEDYGIVYVILKTAQPVLDDAQVYSVRHILITPANSEDESTSSTETGYTDEQWANALNKAEAIVDEYNKGEKTELAFAELAEEYSEDTESTSAGSSGLYGGGYEGTNIGEMVSEFEGWAVDSSRKYGDVDIVKSEYGYHIMYFIFAGPEYYYNAQTDLAEERNNEEIKNYPSKERAGMKNVHIAKPGDDKIYSASTSQ